MLENLNIKKENIPDYLRPAVGSATYDFFMRVIHMPGGREMIEAEKAQIREERVKRVKAQLGRD